MVPRERMAKEYKNPALTVDGILIRNGRILLIERKNEPYKDCWALPGGFVNYGEATETAVLREVNEETGLQSELEQLIGVYSDPNRDPRGHVVSIAYLLKDKGGNPKGGDDAKKARWWDIDALPKLAFDHSKIIADGIKLYNKKNC